MPVAVLAGGLTLSLSRAPRDGTTSTVLLIGELMKQAERYLSEGLHPRVIVEVRLRTPPLLALARAPGHPGRLLLLLLPWTIPCQDEPC